MKKDLEQNGYDIFLWDNPFFQHSSSPSYS